jgi:hypothetical protein
MLHIDPQEIDRLQGYRKRSFRQLSVVERISTYCLVIFILGSIILRLLA